MNIFLKTYQLNEEIAVYKAKYDNLVECSEEVCRCMARTRFRVKQDPLTFVYFLAWFANLLCY